MRSLPQLLDWLAIRAQLFSLIALAGWLIGGVL